MKIAGIYSFAGGEKYIAEHHSKALLELEKAILKIKASECKIKESKEKTMKGRLLYSPVELNKRFGKYLLLSNGNMEPKYIVIIQRIFMLMDIHQRKVRLDLSVIWILLKIN